MQTGYSASRLRRFIWKAASRCGGPARRWAWDDQFQRNQWDWLATRSPRTLALVERFARGGRIIELGCGAGGLAAALPQRSFTSYLGMDVSAAAIARVPPAARRPGCEFRVCDMESWEGLDDGSNADVILIEEALYYLNEKSQSALLSRCLASLTPGGAVVVIVHDVSKHAPTLATVRRAAKVLLDEQDGTRGYVVIGR